MEWGRGERSVNVAVEVRRWNWREGGGASVVGLFIREGEGCGAGGVVVRGLGGLLELRLLLGMGLRTQVWKW